MGGWSRVIVGKRRAGKTVRRQKVWNGDKKDSVFPERINHRKQTGFNEEGLEEEGDAEERQNQAGAKRVKSAKKPLKDEQGGEVQ